MVNPNEDLPCLLLKPAIRQSFLLESRVQSQALLQARRVVQCFAVICLLLEAFNVALAVPDLVFMVWRRYDRLVVTCF